MILLILISCIGVALLIGGIIWSHFDDWSMTASAFQLLGGFGSAVALIIWVVTICNVNYQYKLDYDKFDVTYDNTVALIEQSKNDSTINPLLLASDINKINNLIIDSRNWRDNIWVGCFTNPYYGDNAIITIK